MPFICESHGKHFVLKLIKFPFYYPWIPFFYTNNEDRQVATEPELALQEVTEPTLKPASIPENETSKPATPKPTDSNTSEISAITGSPKPPSINQAGPATGGSHSKPEDVHVHVSVSVAEKQ